MAPLESIGAVLAQPGFKLTGSPESRWPPFTGKRRAHNSELRAASQANGYRRPRRLKAAGYLRKLARYGFEPKPPPMLVVIDHLLSQAGDLVACNQAEVARVKKLSVSSLHHAIDHLESKHAAERIDRKGGRGIGLLLKIDRAQLERYRKELAHGTTTTAGGSARRTGSWLTKYRECPQPSADLRNPEVDRILRLPGRSGGSARNGAAVDLSDNRKCVNSADHIAGPGERGGTAGRASGSDQTAENSESLESPLNPSKKRSGSASSGLRPSGPLRERRKPKTAPTVPELRTKWRRAMQLGSATKRIRLAIAVFRETLWHFGFAMRESMQLAQAASFEAYSIRSASRRDPWLRAVMARLLRDHKSLPSTFAGKRFWIRQAEEWLAHHQAQPP